MTDATVTEKSKNPKAPKLFSDELIDQLLAEVQGKDAESILGESGLAGQVKKQVVRVIRFALIAVIFRAGIRNAHNGIKIFNCAACDAERCHIG